MGPRKILVPVAAILLLAACWGIEDSYLLYLAKLLAINAIVVYGLNFLMGYAGQAYLAIGASFAVGAYVSALSMMQLGLPFLVAWPGGAVLAGIFGVLTGLPALRLAGAYLAMVSIAFNVVLQETLVNWASVTGGAMGVPGVPPIGIGTLVLDDHAVLALIVAVALATIFVAVAFRKSLWGLAFVAMRESEVASRSLGIDTVRLKAVAFFVSSVIAGLAGGLYGHSIGYVSPDIGTIFASVSFVLMLVLGGIGTAWGPLIGAVILTLLPQWLFDFERYHLLVLGIILLVSIMLMPKGIASLVRRRRTPEAKPGVVDPTGGFTGLAEFASGSGSTALAIDEIRKSFGGVDALRGVSLRVEPGTIHGLIGPNGSGKSTLVNVVTGLYRAGSGAVRFGERELGGRSMRRIAAEGVVRTFQTPQPFAELTVRENLMAAQFRHGAAGIGASLFALPASRRATAQAADATARLARALGLTALLDHHSGALPQGDQRRLEIVRALAAHPGILILDEPAAGLSEVESEALCVLLDHLRREGIGLLLIEHHMDVIMRLCDRITVLDRGRVIAEGTPAEIQADERVRSAYFGPVDATGQLRPAAVSE
jgi:ABC-type branched-subunit amino acid transport system ATPase component/ABC-type branched-subunit amino acid transport system permease subunit